MHSAATRLGPREKVGVTRASLPLQRSCRQHLLSHQFTKLPLGFISQTFWVSIYLLKWPRVFARSIVPPSLAHFVCHYTKHSKKLFPTLKIYSYYRSHYISITSTKFQDGNLVIDPKSFLFHQLDVAGCCDGAATTVWISGPSPPKEVLLG